MELSKLSPSIDPSTTRHSDIAVALAGPLAFTTAQFTLVPPTFGDGNLGRAAVNIVANRLLAMGATPRYLNTSFVIDDDTPVDQINVVADGVRDAAVQAEMEWKTNATRFLTSGPDYGIALAVVGVGEMPPEANLGPQCVHSGDNVILTGPVGAFGTAVQAQLLGLTTVIADDGCSLGDAVNSLLRIDSGLRMMMLPEHGFNEAIKRLAAQGVAVNIDKDAIIVSPAVQAACSIMNMDPLSMPCAGSMIVIVSADRTKEALDALRRSAHATQASVIGTVA